MWHWTFICYIELWLLRGNIRGNKSNCYVWRPVLVKIAIIKLPHRSVFAATVVLFITLLCIFIGGTIFFRRLLITFSHVNYFNVSLVKFFIGSTNAFSHSYCNLYLTVLRVIFYFWYWELFFHWRWELFFTASWIYFLAYNTLRACDWGGLGGCLTFQLGGHFENCTSAF